MPMTMGVSAFAKIGKAENAKDGVLNVHLPKTEKPKPKAVEVKVD